MGRTAPAVTRAGDTYNDGFSASLWQPYGRSDTCSGLVITVGACQYDLPNFDERLPVGSDWELVCYWDTVPADRKVGRFTEDGDNGDKENVFWRRACIPASRREVCSGWYSIAQP